MRVGIIKYNGGNVQSVSFALERLGIEFIITDDANEIQSSDKVIFPGVGEASTTMKYLKSKRLDEVIKNLKQPVLGICLGMQLMCAYSEENATTCLGIFDETVKRFIPQKREKVPHVGWNTMKPLDDWIKPGDSSMYFVHSYYVPVNVNTSAVTEYILPFSAAMKKGNFYAVQFHPEKSAQAGEQLLKNFLLI